MPLFRITVRQMKNANGVRLERGMFVDVASRSFSNPILSDGGKSVQDAFLRIYGIDLKKVGALNPAYLDVEQIG